MQFIKKSPMIRNKVEKSSPQVRELRKSVSGGLAGLSVVCVVGLFGVGHLDTPFTIALWAFAVAIPFLVRDVADVRAEEEHGISMGLEKRVQLAIFGVFSAIVGLIAVFCHFSEWIGALFALLCFYCAQSHTVYNDNLYKKTSEKNEDDSSRCGKQEDNVGDAS